ncbi:MAG TPA: ABC transporter permease [Pyrinomonadaceae bacterium]|nr:ABC transporter permease [Pyrinomonadaceae bacterium]
MRTIWQDIRYGARMLTKNPGVTLVAVITLALGIGGNAAIFGGVSAFILRPLPVPEPNTLVRLAEITDERGVAEEFSYPDFVDYRNQSSAFEGISAEAMVQAALNSENQNDVVWGQLVSGNYFDILRIKPIMGRTFLPEEDKTPGSHAVVVLGHSLWQRRLGSDPNIVGKKVQLNGRSYDVIGIAPESFKGSNFGLSLDFWVPVAMVEELDRAPQLLKDRDSHWMEIIGRIKPGVSLAQASAELSSIAARLNPAYPNERASSTRAVVRNEVDGRFGDATAVIKGASAIAMAIVGLILLIACANVANLLLARAAARKREIGIRLALGASRWRLIRQLLTESLMLSVLGGIAGLVIAYWVTGIMQAFVPLLPYNIVEDFFSIDSRALVFTAIVSLATGIIFGLTPAWHASNPDVVPVLKGDSQSHQGKTRRFTLRNTLVVTQVALSLVVLVCGGLLIKSFRNAQTMDPGFAGRNMLLVSLNPQLVGYDDKQAKNFFQQIVERAASLPGVEAAGAARLLPLSDSSNSSGPILKEGETLPRGSAGRTIMNTVISPGYFQTLQIPILEGRDFDARDREGGQRVVIVNQTMAQMLWPGESAVGKRMFVGVDSRDAIEVVGVVKTGKYRALAEDPKPYYYSPMAQRGPSTMTLVMRTSGDPRGLISAIRNEVQSIDGRIPLFAVKTMQDHLTWALWAPKLGASFSLAFGVVALLLSAVGLYSVMAYVVSQRTREIGIRMALGARRAEVLKLITSQGMKLAAIGVVIGLALALAVSRGLSAILIGISPYDALPFIVVPVLLGLVALIACLLPARRATKVDPIVALRYE